MNEPQRRGFETTQWSLVLDAGQGSDETRRAAFAQLCELYWAPLYFYVRRRIADAHEAQDATQEFFARMIEGDKLRVAEPERGKFRNFLLTSLRNFLSHWHEYKTAQKRGGQATHIGIDFDLAERSYRELVDTSVESAEAAFQRKWATTLLGRVIKRLETEATEKGRSEQFALIQPFLTQTGDGEGYQRIGEKLEMEPATVKVAVHRLRRRLGEMLQEEVMATIADEREFESEMDALFQGLTSANASD